MSRKRYARCSIWVMRSCISDERHQRISDTLEEMMREVDRLISRIDETEDESLENVDEEPSPR
jgi:hypothetical protein